MAAFFNDEQSQSHQLMPTFFVNSAYSRYLPMIPTWTSDPSATIEILPQHEAENLVVTTSPSPASTTISTSSSSSHRPSQIEQDLRSSSLGGISAGRSTMRRNRKNSKDGKKKERHKSCCPSKQANVAVNKEAEAEPPTGYVHVRARRGQATDKHSLAERVRREKISKRMNALQNLVPGCDKLTGKAVVLDEIINYIQSLQNQVELLSMKLLSLQPMACDYNQIVSLGNGADSQLDIENPCQPPFLQPTESNYPTIDMDPSLHLLQQGLQGPHSVLMAGLPQVGANFEMLMDDIHGTHLTAFELENIFATLY